MNGYYLSSPLTLAKCCLSISPFMIFAVSDVSVSTGRRQNVHKLQFCTFILHIAFFFSQLFSVSAPGTVGSTTSFVKSCCCCNATLGGA